FSVHHRHVPSFPTRRSSDLFIPTITLGKEKDYLTIENMECFCYQLPFFDEHDNRQTLILIDDNYHLWAEQIIDKYENALTNLSRSEEHTSELQSRFDLVCRL